MTKPVLLSEEALAAAQGQISALLDTLKTVLFGQEAVLEAVVMGLLAGGHVLLEGLPGLGKTELSKGLAHALGLETKRVQFTPDLLPGDITGSHILESSGGERRLVFQPGPVFCNLLLADEINRASPKTQSALLQAMQEGEITVLGETHALPAPFFVVATQNPIELEGTYPLPEAQIDRFLIKVDIDRNPVAVIEKILQERRPGSQGAEPVTVVMTREELVSLQTTVSQIHLSPVVGNYIARLLNATHRGESKTAEFIRYGASPRAAIGLAAVSRAKALIQGRAHVDFDDVASTATLVLRHRLILEHAAKIEGYTTDSIVKELLNEVAIQEKQIPAVLQRMEQEK